MNFYTYIDVALADFVSLYLNTGLVAVQHHKEFPLDIYTYGREAVFGNVWDKVTSKCRGIIVHRHTDGLRG
jgi:RNA ligase